MQGQCLNVISIYHGSSGSNNDYSVATSEASYQLCVNTIGLSTAELELEFYLFDRQLHNIGEIISKCEIILSGDSHKGTNWPLT